VAEFQSLARTAIEKVVGEGRLPLLVGGSGLYWRAVVDDLVFPPRAAPVRAALEEEAATAGAEMLHARLRAADPTAAETIAPTNVRRIIRALEVIEITGRPFSDYAHAWAQYSSRYDLRAAGLRRPREEMWRRIEARVDRMVADGLIDEARSLAARDMSKVARQALGYRQIIDAHPDASVGQVRDEIVRATKRFARRQESWFRTDPRIVWFDAAAPELSRDLAAFFTR
jgi:tRNA dimethylallyltransferase